MKPETLELQHLLDPTTGAQAVEELQYPIAVCTYNSEFGKHLLISDKKEIIIYKWPITTTLGFDKLKSGEAAEMPISDFIAELESIISELKSK